VGPPCPPGSPPPPRRGHCRRAMPPGQPQGPRPAPRGHLATSRGRSHGPAGAGTAGGVGRGGGQPQRGAPGCRAAPGARGEAEEAGARGRTRGRVGVRAAPAHPVPPEQPRLEVPSVAPDPHSRELVLCGENRGASARPRGGSGRREQSGSGAADPRRPPPRSHPDISPPRIPFLFRRSPTPRAATGAGAVTGAHPGQGSLRELGLRTSSGMGGLGSEGEDGEEGHRQRLPCQRGGGSAAFNAHHHP